MSAPVGYVDVATRLREAYQRWPDLRIQEGRPILREVAGLTFIEITTTVWRDPDDPMPAIAAAWEPIPGKTAFTRDSEMMNCSTSALGRALGIMGIESRSSIASRDEVRARQPDAEPTFVPRFTKPKVDPDPTKAIPRGKLDDPATGAQLARLKMLHRSRGDNDWVPEEGLTKVNASALIALMEGNDAETN